MALHDAPRAPLGEHCCRADSVPAVDHHEDVPWLKVLCVSVLLIDRLAHRLRRVGLDLKVADVGRAHEGNVAGPISLRSWLMPLLEAKVARLGEFAQGRPS